MKTSIWHNCYDETLKAFITPASFAHPAKMAKRLCERIFEYGEAEGYWQPGDPLVDPFGGIGCTGLIGAYRGYPVVMIELEPHFVALTQANIQKNAGKLQRLGKPLPVVIQGDARRLSQLLSEASSSIFSPPYAESVNQSDGANDSAARLERKSKAGVDVSQAINRGGPNSVLNQAQVYGQTAGQIGAESGETYWQAMAQVYTELHTVLKPGGVAAIVVKDYVRNKQRVPLCDQTAQLLEAVGFTVVERTRAMLVKETHVGIDMFSGEHVTQRTERKSFFRRLAESKGSPRIDYEEIIWAQK